MNVLYKKSFLTTMVLSVVFSLGLSAQYEITGDATQTINFSGYDGGGFEPGAVTSTDGTLDSNMWGVDLDNDGTMDIDFGDPANTTEPYAGGEGTNQHNVSPWGPGEIRAWTYNEDKLGVRHSIVGHTNANGHNGDIALILRIQNSTGSDITSLQIAHSLKSYTSGGTAEIEFYHSADNSTYTEIVGMGNTFAAGTNWGNASTDLNTTVSTSISNTSYYYLKWVFKESAAGSVGSGFYDLQITATVATGDGEGTLTAGTTNFGDLASTSVSDPGEDVFDFIITDDASTGDDSFPIQFTDVLFNAAASDGIDDWSDVLAGARLEDGSGNFINASSIGTSSITFSGIPITSSDLGYVTDNGSKTYTLSVWFNTSISEDIDSDLLHVDVDGADFTFSGATSTITLTETAESNTAYNTIQVTGTNWGFDNPPLTVGISENFDLTIAAVDIYGNVDEDDNTSQFILSRGTGTGTLTAGGGALATQTLTSGRYTASDFQYDTEEEFDINADDSGGSFLTSATSATITAAVSFQSITGGVDTDWSTIGNWQFWNGTAWVAASNYPTSTTGTIYIRNGTTINIDVDFTADQIIVENGGTLQMGTNGAVLTLADGPGTDLIVESGGVWSYSASNANAVPTFTGTAQVQGGGTLQISNTNVLDDFGEETQIDWLSDAVLYYTATGEFPYNTNFFPGIATGTYPILEVDGATSDPGLWSVNGILKVNSGTFTVDAGNGVTIRDGFTGDGNIVVDLNDLTYSGSTLFLGGSGSLDLNGGTLSLAGLTVQMMSDKEVFNGTLELDGASIINSGTFSLNDGANDNLNVTISDGAVIYSNAVGGLASTLAIGGTYTVGNALDFYFEGSSQQTLGFGTIGVTAADNVTINNAAGVILDSDLTINERLTLTSGVFSTTSSAEIITISSAATIVGASNTNYFDGPLEIQGITSSQTFHVGDGADYRPVILNPASSSNFTIEHIASTPTDNTDVTSPVTGLVVNRYWTIDRGSGTGNVEVTLDFDAETSGSNELRVARYNTGTTSWEEAGTGYDSHTSTTVTSTTSSFSDFTVASTSMTLPVELVDFTASVDGTTVELIWSTSSELDNDRFEVEHSLNGVDFVKIGEVKGAGTTHSEQEYAFTHGSPSLRSNFYRLKQIDFDGAFEYSFIVRVDVESLTASLQLLRNPIENQTLEFRYPQSALSNVKILSTSGKDLGAFNMREHSGTYQVDVRALPQGIYLLKLGDETVRFIMN